MKRRLAWVLALVALACLPKLGNAFVWDDLPLLVESDFVYDISNLPRVFLHDTMFAADGGKFQAKASLDTYRPVTMVSFFVDAAISGRAPWAYHLDNLLIHLLCTALVFMFALRLLGGADHHLAPWAAAWFGLHPVLAEAHIWINGRSDLWCTLFGLSALLLWWRAPSDTQAPLRFRRAVAVYALCLLGLLSKESLAPALCVAMVWDLGFFQKPLRTLRLTRQWFVRAAPIALAVVSYVALRGLALSGLHTSAGGPQLLAAVQNLPLLWVDGLLACFAPVRVMPRYLLEEYGAWSLQARTVAIACVLLLTVLTLRMRTRAPAVALGLAWYAITLAPACLITTLAWYGFGRYLYLPFAVLIPGLVAGLPLIAHSMPRLVPLARPLAFSAMLLFGLRLGLSAPQWDGPLAFYTAIISEDPTASHGNGGLGKLLVENGKPEQALGWLEKAVQRNPQDHRYLNNLATAYLRTGRDAQALNAATVGAQRFPDQAKFLYVQALVWVHRDSPSQVAAALAAAMRIEPQHAGSKRLLVELTTLHPRKDAYQRALQQELPSPTQPEATIHPER